jgi:DNA-binding transcriptional LysR family regulator
LQQQACNWLEAAAQPLCLLTPEMHNRAIVDRAFQSVGVTVQPAIETDSILTLALTVLVGEVCSVLPGAMVAVVSGYGELEALPLHSPQVRTPIGLMYAKAQQPSRTLQAALDLAVEPGWLAHAQAHAGSLQAV